MKIARKGSKYTRVQHNLLSSPFVEIYITEKYQFSK